MSTFIVELFMTILGTIGACQIIPQCVRIHRREKSDDISFWTIGINIMSQSVWLVYSFWKFVPCMIISGSVWLTLLLIMLGLVVKHRGENK